jgi:hypothetical protein
MTQTDPIERAKARLGEQYPGAKISTRDHHGQPIALVAQGDLIRLVRLTSPEAERGSATA